MRKIGYFAFVFGLLFSLVWNCNADAKEKRLAIAATGTSSGYYAYMVALAKAIHENEPDISGTVIETGGVTDNTNRLIRKQADLGLGQNIAAYQSFYGKGKWDNDPHPEIRVHYSFGATALVIAVREDSGINSIHELDGKRFCAGSRGSGNEKMLMMVLDFLGIKPKYYRATFGDAGEAVANDQIVGYSKWSASERIGDSQIVSLAITTKLKFLGIPDEDMKKIRAEFPYILPGTQYPNCYRNQDYEVRTIGALKTIHSTSRLSQEMGYKVTKAVWEKKDIMGEAYSAAKGVNILKESLRSPILLHAGTVQYAKEMGIEVPQNLIPPEYKQK